MNISPADYFKSLEECWHDAAAVTGIVEHNYKIANRQVTMALAGAPLHPLMTAPFSHLQSPAEVVDRDLSIRIWDGAASGIAIPPPPCGIEDFTARGELKNFSDDRYRASYQPYGRILNVFDTQRRCAYVGISDATKIHSFERAVPLRPIFGWFMAIYGDQLVHAASVGTERGGVLIVGAGGAGKSNTALGSLVAGLDFVSDDFCVVSADPIPQVHSLYCTSRVRKRDWAALSFPRRNPDEPESEKSLHFLNDYFPGKISAGYRLWAMLLPQIGGTGSPTVQPVSSTAAIAQMASQSASMLPNAGSEVLHRLMKLARKLPTYRLELGTQPKIIPILIRQVIDAAADKMAASVPKL